MSIWQQLGIEPTSDQKQIKKAYAKQLKLIDQEVQINEFIQLREAYKQAQFEAQWIVEDEVNAESEKTLTKNSENDQTDLNQIDEKQTFDLLIQIEQNIQIFKEQLSTRDPLFDIKKAILNIKLYLYQHTSHQQYTYYLQQIIEILYENELEDFQYLLHDQQNFEHDVQIDDVDLTHSAAFNPPAHFSPNPENFLIADVIQTEDYEKNIITLSEEVINQLLQSNTDDQIFLKCQHVLSSLYELTLNTQIQIKEQLAIALINLEFEYQNTSLTRFFKLWLDHFPEDYEHYQDTYPQLQLQERLHDYLLYNHTYRHIPEEKIPDIKIFQEDSFHPIVSYNIKKSIEKNSKDLNFFEVIDNLNIENIQYNSNYLFLKTLNKNFNLFILNVIFSSINYIFWVYFSESTISKENVLISTVLFSLAYPFIQPYLLALICGNRDQEYKLHQYKLIWFITGIILSLTPMILNINIHHIFTYFWFLISLPLIGSLILTSEPLKSYRFDHVTINIDIWVIYLAIFSISGFIITTIYSFISNSFPWLLIFTIIPISFILFPNSFKSIFLSFGSKNKNPDEDEKIVFFRSIFSILIRALILFILIYFIYKKQSLSYILYLAPIYLISLFLTLSDTLTISKILQYFGYFIFLCLSLTFLVVAPPLGFAGLSIFTFGMYKKHTL